MALTGLGMVGFACVHLLGNSSIFVGANGINAYAEHLHSLGPLVWVFRLIMLGMAAIHICYGIQLTIENKAANPDGYAVNRKTRATFSSETMIWTGLIIFGFIIYHLLHFTVRVTPGVVKAMDAAGRFDVFTMVVSSFHGVNAIIYIIAMAALFLHLAHGIQSLFQTVGLSSDCTQPAIVKGGKAVAIILGIGYIAIPLTILVGILK